MDADVEFKRLDVSLDVPGIAGVRCSTSVTGGVVVSLMWPRKGCSDAPLWCFPVGKERVVEFSSFPFAQRVYRECYLAATGSVEVELVRAGAGA